MNDKPISSTRTGGTETLTFADGRTETRTFHVPTPADRWPKGEGVSHTPGRDEAGRVLPVNPNRMLRSAAYSDGAVHIFYSDGSRDVVKGVAPQEWIRVRTARNRSAAIASLGHSTRNTQ